MDACPWLLAGLTTTIVLQRLVASSEAMLTRFLTLPSSAAGPANLASRARLCGTAALLGLATPLCSCGAIPLALALGAAGCAPAAVVAFLTAAQSSGLDSVAITVGVLGWRAAAYRLVGSVTLAVAAGLAVGDATSRPTDNNRGGGRATAAAAAATAASAEAAAADAPRRVESLSLVLIAHRLYRLFEEVWIVVALGILVSVLAEDRWGAAELMSSPSSSSSSTTFGWASDLASRVAVVVGALPFQLCEHGVVSFAQALQKAGASTGLAHAFLLCAPATNFASLGAVLRSCGNRPVAAVRSAAALCTAAVVLSYLTDAFLAKELSLLAQPQPAHRLLVLPEWWRRASVYVCGTMVCASLLNHRRRVGVYTTLVGLAVVIHNRWPHEPADAASALAE
jgi:uncharacterized membrane protein YraQ (UPF0718 family)